MKKKYLLLSVVGALMLLVSFGLGYAYGHIHAMMKAVNMQVTTHGRILFTNSVTLTQRLKSPDTAELIEATEENGDSLRRLLIDLQPVIDDPRTRKFVEMALAEWGKARERLQELRALQSKSANDGSASEI